MKLEATRGVGTTFARAAALAVVAAGCGELGAPGAGTSPDDGSQRGELAIYVVDGKDGQSDLRYALRAPSGLEQALLFDSVRDMDLAPGTEIKVWGTDSPDGLRVTSFRAVSLSPDEVRRSALINGPAYNPRSFAFVLLDLGGGFNPAIDETLVMGRMINNADSIRNYYISDSYGRQDITTQVFGPIKAQLMGCTTGGNTSGPGLLAADMRATIPGTFQHYLWYFGTSQSACAWSGLASLGTPDKPSKDTWYNASTNCVVLVQEPGHNFGMQHSASLACPGASLLDDPSKCTVSEYGDSFDPMGGGCRHMNAWQKAYQGWFGGCNGVTVTSSGTFTLLPIETRCDGAQFLKVKAAKSRPFTRPAAGGGAATTETLAYYYVELRTPVDFDGMLGNRSQLAPQILIHAADDIRGRAAKGLHTFLLDMTPSTTGSKGFTDAALPLGATFTDPAGGVTITATAIGSNQATITVEIEGGTGAPACLDGTSFAAPGPGPDSCGMATTGSGGASGTGGVTSSGGAMGAGGRGGSGGSSTGGRGGAGGRGTAGSSGAAGKTGSGGTTATGGQTGTGSGGAVSTGGSGGGNGSGGATGTGGGVQGSGGNMGMSSGGNLGMSSGGNMGTGTGGNMGTGSGGSNGSGSGGAAGPGVIVGGGCSLAGSGGSSAPAMAFGSSLVAALAFRQRRRRR